MRRLRFVFDRFSDFHVLLFFAVALAAAGMLALVLLGTSRDAGRAGIVIGIALGAGALALGGWAWLQRASERRRRARLDTAVDAEMSDKWEPGFSRVVGVYQKPWYLLCGETAVGKTAALRAANLPMALGPDGRPITDRSQGLNGTFMFDWWFFEDAVVLDSAGDLIENPDQRWIGFLDRVREARPIQPLNGMILAVAATDLMGDPDALRAKAALLARQVQVARERLRVRFPLYLLVTKSDLITGFADYFPLGADIKSTFQIMGWSNPQDPRVDDLPPDPAEVRAGLEQFVRQLRARRVRTVARAATSRPDAQFRVDHLDEMYAFPDTVADLLDNLQAFVTHVLDRAGGAAPPFLRGVYFTSALRSGEALDVELRRAFGLEQLPASRRAASNRAYFIRDLFLEKIIPEAGMVTPLENVVAGIRRRGRTIAAGNVAAAAALLLGSALGYLQTAGRMRPHARFWDELATAADRGRLAEFALFSTDGRYRGREKPSAPAVAGTVLEFHRAAQELASTAVYTPLLPTSAEIDAERLTTHRKVFCDGVLLPTLNPAPLHPGAAAESQIQIVANLLRRVSPTGEGPTLGELLPSATALLDARTPREAAPAGPPWTTADADAVSTLLQSGVARYGVAGPAGGGQPTLDPMRRRVVSAEAVAAVAAWLGRVGAVVDAHASAVRPQLDAIRSVAERERELLAALPEQPGRPVLAHLGRLADDSEDAIGKAVSALREAGALPLGTRGTAVLEPTAGLQLLRAASTDPAGGPASRQLAAALAEYDSRAKAAAAALCAAAGRPLTGDAALRSVRDTLGEFERTLIGTEPDPIVRRRLAAYKTLAVKIAEWTNGDAAGKPFETAAPREYPHPFFGIPDALSEVRRQVAGELATLEGRATTLCPAADTAPPLPGAGLHTEFTALVRKSLAQAREDREVHVWRTGLAEPDRVWLTPGANGRTPTALDVRVVADAAGLVTRYKVPDDLSPRHVRAWVAALDAADREAREFHPRSDPDKQWVGQTLDDVAGRLHAYASEHYLPAWAGVISGLARPNLTDWAAVQRLRGRPARDVQSELAGALGQARDAATALRDVTAVRWPDLSEKARQLTDRCAPLAPENADAVMRFLSSFAPDALATRKELLSDPERLDQTFAHLLRPQERQTDTPGGSPPPPPATVSAQFWNALVTQAVGRLRDESRPHVRKTMAELMDAADGRFPLCNGTKAWQAPDLAPIRQQIEAIRPGRSATLKNELSVAVRDLGLVNDAWADYLKWLRALEHFLTDNTKWSLTIDKADRQGTWQAARLRQLGPDRPVRQGFRPPLTFELDGGAARRLGLQLELLSSTEPGAEVRAKIAEKDVDLAQDWSLLRLVASRGLRFRLRTEDPTGKDTRNLGVDITVNVGGAPFPPDHRSEVPAVPAVPD